MFVSTRKACEEVNCWPLYPQNDEAIKWNKRAQEHLKQDCNMTAGLEEVIHLAVGACVMLRRNLNTEAGLVNGGCRNSAGYSLLELCHSNILKL